MQECFESFLLSTLTQLASCSTYFSTGQLDVLSLLDLEYTAEHANPSSVGSGALGMEDLVAKAATMAASARTSQDSQRNQQGRQSTDLGTSLDA